MVKTVHPQDEAFGELEVLRKSIRLHWLLLDHTRDMIAIHKRADLTFIYVNQAVVKYSGFTREELLSNSPFDFIHPEDHGKAADIFKQCMPAHTNGGEIRYRKKDGSYFWLEIINTFIYQQDEDDFIVMISRDTNEGKQAAEVMSQACDNLESVKARTARLNQPARRTSPQTNKLIYKEQPLKIGDIPYPSVFKNSSTPAVIVGKDLKILDVNARMQLLTGYSRDELIGADPFRLLLVPDYLPEVKANYRLRQIDPAQAPQDYEIEGIDSRGQIRNLILNVVNIPDSEYIAVSAHDVTEKKQAEKALARQIASQTLLLEIAKNFNSIVTFNTDAMINMSLKMIGEFDNNDRSYVFMMSDDGLVMNNTHEWCAEGIEPCLQSLQNIPVTKWAQWRKKFRNHEYVYIPKVASMLPKERREKEHLQAKGTKSLLAVPMILEDKVIGFLGFDSIRCERIWTQENIILLDSVAQIITKALERKTFATALQSSESTYRTIFQNTGAATFISEEDLSISMVNDKFLELLGYTKDEVIGAKWTKFVPPKLAEVMESYHRIRRIDPATAPRNYKTQMIDKQGKILDGLNVVDLIPGTKCSAQTFINLTEYNRIVRALKAISSVNLVMIHSNSEHDLLTNVCKNIVDVGGYSLAWVGYLEDDPRQRVKPVACAGNDFAFLSKLNISLTDPKRGSGPTGTAIRNGQPVVIRDFKKDPGFAPWLKNALRRGFKSGITIPLKDDKEVFGVLNIYANEVDFLDTEEEKLIVSMANNLAYAITSHRAHERCNLATYELGINLEKMQRILMQSVTALGTTLDIRDPYTAGHQKKVVRLATAIAERLGVSWEQMEGIKVAANLHDIGKIYIPSQILNKPGKLTNLEFEMIKTHSQTGYEIIKEIEFPWPVAEIILQHHERMDGSGYPRNLAGEEILLEARILAVADVVEAMASHRPYRPALGIDVAMDEISCNRGILYDPDVVDACLVLFREKDFRFE